MKPETKLKKNIVRELKKIPRSSWHVIDQSCIRGDPDIMGCVDGRFYGIEVKEEFTERYDKREKLQRWKLARIIKAGGTGLFLTKRSWKHHIKKIAETVKE